MELKYDISSEKEKITDAEIEYMQKKTVSKLEFILMEYQEQMLGIDGRIKNKKSKMQIACITFFIVFVIDAVFSFILSTDAGSILGDL